MKRFALTVSVLALAVMALAACGDEPPTLEELESSGALTASNGASNYGDGGACRIPGSTGIPTCDQCAQQQCCEAIVGCNADPACLSADRCIAQCDQAGYQAQRQGDPNLAANWQNCYNQCTTQNPPGMQRRQIAVQCIPTKCAQYCPQNVVK